MVSTEDPKPPFGVKLRDVFKPYEGRMGRLVRRQPTSATARLTVIRDDEQLQRMGSQMFLAIHNYILLKEFDLQREPKDAVLFHALDRDDETGEVSCNSTSEFDAVAPNPLVDTMVDIYERDVKRDFSDTSSTKKKKGS